MIGTAYDDDRLFYFSEQDGFHRLDDLVISSGQPDDLARWFTAGTFNSGYHPLSDPTSNGYGYLTGCLIEGAVFQAFILTPVPVAVP